MISQSLLFGDSLLSGKQGKTSKSRNSATEKWPFVRQELKVLLCSLSFLFGDSLFSGKEGGTDAIVTASIIFKIKKQLNGEMVTGEIAIRQPGARVIKL